MNHIQWAEHVENIRRQYLEGAIYAEEYFNAVIARATEVEPTPEAPDETGQVS